MIKTNKDVAFSEDYYKQSLSKASVKIEIISLMPTFYSHCHHCMHIIHAAGLKPYEEQLNEYPKEMREEYFAISKIGEKLICDFRFSVNLEVTDGASVKGFWKSLRHKIWKYPVVLINGKKVFNRIPEYKELKEKIFEYVSEVNE